MGFFRNNRASDQNGGVDVEIIFTTNLILNLLIKIAENSKPLEGLFFCLFPFFSFDFDDPL